MKKENTYVMNMEAAYIYKDIAEDKKITLRDRDLNKLFSATIPYSLETMRMDKMFKGVFYQHKGKQYTKKVINVTFDKHYFVIDEKTGDRKVVKNKNSIRGYLYNNGFTIDNTKYVFYKRGAGKAKNGYALFIQEDMKAALINRSRLGLEFKENEEVDLTSLLAYESLISSGITSTINLDPKTEILIIDDINGKKFEVTASVTREENGELITSNQKIELQNCLTDGQGLLDESVFESYNKSNKGFMLLRSDMFKCCAFNTKLQKWFKANGVEKLNDMFGNEYDARNIKLVTTPNSLKYLKFAYKFEGVDDERHRQRLCHQHWINNIDNIFGVVKYDSEGNFGNYNRLTYQLLNSIPTLTYEDLMEITKDEREYVDLLKNNEAVFRNHILKDNELSYMIEERIESGDMSKYEAMDSMYCLYLANPDIQYTSKFKDIKKKLIFNYIENLKRGKIRLKDTKYTTLISNPFEMLKATLNLYNETSIMQGREVYCSYYDDGQEFCISRNPHINSGNVMWAKNKHREEYKEWFNFTDNICVMNFYDNDAPDRLQGCDTDSDTALMIPNDTLCRKAKHCEERFPTPINKVKGRSVPKKNNMNQLKRLDVVLGNNYIGKIVNMSQIINSYMNDAIYRNESKSVIDELYQASSKLSSLSQIEIDKSKKVFDNVNMAEELKKIRNIKAIRYVEGEDRFGAMVNKMIVPSFFEMVSESNDYRVLQRFNTPMDVLQDVLVFKGSKRTPNIQFSELIVKPKDIGDFNGSQIEKICNIIIRYGKRINGLMVKTCILNEAAKATIRRRERDATIEELKSLKIIPATILNVLRRAFKVSKDEYGLAKYSMACLSLLLESNKGEVLMCFKSKDVLDSKILIESEDNSYSIFGEKYEETTLKSLYFSFF